MKMVMILAASLGVIVLALTPSGAVGSPSWWYEVLDPENPCCYGPDGTLAHTPKIVSTDKGPKVSCYDCKIKGRWYARPGHYSSWSYGWNLANWTIGYALDPTSAYYPVPWSPPAQTLKQTLLHSVSSVPPSELIFYTGTTAHHLSSVGKNNGRETLYDMIDKMHDPLDIDDKIRGFSLFSLTHFNKHVCPWENCVEDDKKMLWQYIVTITMSADNLPELNSLRPGPSVAQYYSLVTRTAPKDYTRGPSCPGGYFGFDNTGCSQDAGIKNCECCYKGNQLLRDSHSNQELRGASASVSAEGSKPLLECQ